MMRLEDFRGVNSAELPALPPPRARRPNASPFISGPIPVDWVRQAIRLPKPAMGVGLTLWLLRGIQRGAAQLRIDQSFRKRLGLSADQTRRGAHALAKAGLVKVIKQGRGRCLVVQLVTTVGDAFT